MHLLFKFSFFYEVFLLCASLLSAFIGYIGRWINDLGRISIFGLNGRRFILSTTQGWCYGKSMEFVNCEVGTC